MKIHPQAKRHTDEIIDTIARSMHINLVNEGEEFLSVKDYQKIREKLEKKFTRLLNKNKNCVCFPRPGEVDWFNSDPKNCYNNS